MTQERHRRAALGRTERLRSEEAARERRDSGGECRPRRSPDPVRDEEEEKPRRHSLTWLLLALFSLLGTTAAALAVIPQVTGTAITGVPRVAFVGQRLVFRDEAAVDALTRARSEAEGTVGVFSPGISIDGLDVGGMAYEEALAAVLTAQPTGGGDFSITVRIAGRQWQIDSSQVPMTRDTEEVVLDAWAQSQLDVDPLPGETVLSARLRALEERKAHPIQFQTGLSFDRASIRPLTDAIAAQFSTAPVNAALVSFDPVTHDFTVSADRNGTVLDADALYDQVMAELDAGRLYGQVSMEPEVLFAPVTVSELQASLGRISTYTTKTTSNKNRNTNIRLSAEAINGYCVRPGELFSFNQATGQRTERKGYKPAAAISGGKSQDEIGGGVCQTSSTLFNAVARANFEVVSRSPHAWPSTYVEKGFDATVNWPGLDFQWRNNTDQPVWIVAEYANRQVTVSLYGVTLGEGVTIDLASQVTRTIPKPDGIKEVYNPELPYGSRETTVQGRKGYEVETWQIWYHDGIEIDRRLLCKSTYKAYQETVEYNY